VPQQEPQFLTPGESWQWTRVLPDYPPSEGWALNYYLTGPYSLALPTTPQPTSNNYLVHATPAGSPATNLVLAGIYRWVARVSLGADVYDAGSGKFTILANPAVNIGTVVQSHASKMLALLELEIQARITGTGNAHMSYGIEGRSIAKLDLSTLYSMRAKYAREVAQERGDGKLPAVEIRFSRMQDTSQSFPQWNV
jgi:hypothetical protein